MPHSYVSLKYHIVFSTKHRLAWIEPSIEEELHRFIGGIVRNEGGQMLAIGGVEDHVHILAGLPQTRALSDMVRAIKASSSSFGKRVSDNPDFGWQAGYAAFSVSESQVSRVQRYILRQKEHHQTTTYEDEIRGMLQRHHLRPESSFFEEPRPAGSPEGGAD